MNLALTPPERQRSAFPTVGRNRVLLAGGNFGAISGNSARSAGR
jgi:hypothetical protein